MDLKILKDKNFIISSSIIKSLDKDLSLNEFLIILYFINNNDSIFDVETISKTYDISLNEVLSAFNSLLNKELIEIKQGKDIQGKITDIVSIDKIYNKVLNNYNSKNEDEERQEIFTMIETELDHKLTPIDYEIINTWFESKTPLELIKGAIKDASYNGVKTLRFIDKRLYDWNKKGLKTIEDVEKYIKNNESSKTIDLSIYEDYDWLNDDE